MTVEPVDDDLIQLFRSRDGTRTDVTLKDGRIFAVFDIAWGYDFDDPYAHISTNVSPDVEGQSFDFFFTREIAVVTDPEDEGVLYEPSW
jgi:hypothetical protein